MAGVDVGRWEAKWVRRAAARLAWGVRRGSGGEEKWSGGEKKARADDGQNVAQQRLGGRAGRRIDEERGATMTRTGGFFNTVLLYCVC